MKRLGLAVSTLPALALLASLLPSCTKSEDGAAAEPDVGLAPRSAWPKFRADASQTGRGHFGPSTTSTGTLWEVKTAKGIFSSPVIAEDGTTFIGSADRTFYAIDRAGNVRWKLLTGEIIDSSALLDDRGRVYFGSGDGKLRALDAASGAPVWTMEADDPAVNKSFIRWFEGNVAIGPSGTLYVPNDNFFLYANGTWIKNTEIPPDRGRYGAGSALEELTDKRTADLITELSRTRGPAGSDARKIGDYFASFMDEAGIEAKLVQKLRRGGSGVWGPMAMPPNPDIAESDAVALIQWVLGL